jgi:hypothetical protein
MPKLRESAVTQENRALIATIKYGMDLLGLSMDQLATAMRKDKVTLYRRFKQPETFTLEELRFISTKLHIPLEKLVKGEFA